MATRRILLVNPMARSFTTRPIFMNRALYSPLAGLLAVAALIPQDRYEVILIDENIEPIDFDIKADLVGISAMTSYVKRGYQIADEFRRRGIPVIMGGVHPSFMPEEALQHANAVVVGEAEFVMAKVLEDLDDGCMGGIYKAERLHSMVGMPLPRYDLMKTNRYVNTTYIQTSRGCHHACAFCAEHVMYGLKFRYRPLDEVMREIDASGARTISLNDADFFGTPKRAAELMRALKGRGIRWQAGVNTREAHNDELLKLAAESGCYMLSLGFESISRQTLRNVHKFQNSPDKYKELVEKIQSYGILVFGLFMFGFDGEDPSVFEETANFNIDANFDACAYSIMTPYPGTITWYEMMKDGRVTNFDWDMYDQGNIVFDPIGMTRQSLEEGHTFAYNKFYSLPSIVKRFPLRASRSRFYWSVYNLFFRRGEMIKPERSSAQILSQPPTHAPHPPLLPQKAAWRELAGAPEPSPGVVSAASHRGLRAAE
jgi:radical SAM superfamily enzyme YgiQ (UPF0313 family)